MNTPTFKEWKIKLDRIVFSLGITLKFWDRETLYYDATYSQVARELLDDLHHEITQNTHKYICADDQGYADFNEEANAFKIIFSHFLFKSQDASLLMAHLVRTYPYLKGLMRALFSVRLALRLDSLEKHLYSTTHYDSSVAAFQKSIKTLNDLHHQLLMLTDFNKKNKSACTKHLRDEINKVYINQALAIISSLSELTCTNSWFSDFVDPYSADAYIDARDEFHNAARSNETLIKIFTQATETGNLHHAHVITNLFATLNNLKVYPKEKLRNGAVPGFTAVPNIANIHTTIWKSCNTNDNTLLEERNSSQTPSSHHSERSSPK